MRTLYRTTVFAALPLIVAAFADVARAHMAALSLSAREVAGAISGKVCTTGGGARFSFGSDGRFEYHGLWQSRGSYTIGPGAVVVTFDSGLRRTFTFSIREGALHMEQTRVACESFASGRHNLKSGGLA